MSNKNNNAAPKTKEQDILKQVEEVKDIMHNNIDKMVKNIDNLEVLHDKTDEMRQSSLNFKKGATTLKRNMWWKDLKLKLLIAFIILVILAIIVGVLVAKFKN